MHKNVLHGISLVKRKKREFYEGILFCVCVMVLLKGIMLDRLMRVNIDDTIIIAEENISTSAL